MNEIFNALCTDGKQLLMFKITHVFYSELRRSQVGSDTLQDTHRSHPCGRPAHPHTQLHTDIQNTSE